MADRNFRQLHFSDAALKGLEKTIKRSGMTQKELLSRLCAWFALLDIPGQQLVLGTIPIEYIEDAAKHLAQRSVAMTKAIKPPSLAGETPAIVDDSAPSTAAAHLAAAVKSNLAHQVEQKRQKKAAKKRGKKPITTVKVGKRGAKRGGGDGALPLPDSLGAGAGDRGG